MNDIFSQVLITSITLIIIVIITLFIYYLFSKKKYNEKRKVFEELHLNLKEGQKVEFSNGLIGEIHKVGDEICDIKIKSGAIISVSRFAITRFIK